MNLNMNDDKIGVKNEQGEAKEQMISLLSAASAITADTASSGQKALDGSAAASGLKSDGLVGKTMSSELDEDVPMTFPQRVSETPAVVRPSLSGHGATVGVVRLS